MSVILTLSSALPGNATLSSTTSGDALTEILTGAAIVGGALIASLVATELLSSRQVWNKRAAAAVRVINVTLVVTFCAYMVFRTAQLL